jgi:hypothetical protein
MSKKYALLISGQPRYRDIAVKSIIDNIINFNDIDIYCHFWINSKNVKKYDAISNMKNLDNDIENNEDTYINKFKELLPKNTIFELEDQIDFNPNKYYPGTEHDRVILEVGNELAQQHFNRCNFNIQSQWYSIMKVNELRKKIQNESKIVYDGIFRLRPDVYIPNPITLNNYDINKINIPFCNDSLDTLDSYGICEFEDPCAFGSCELMDIYCNNYLYQEETLKHPGIVALLSGYPLGVYLKKYVGYNNIINNNFEFNTHWTTHIIRV